MPIREYKCKKCGHVFEVIQTRCGEDVKGCEKCGGEVDRLFSVPSPAQFKGNGFYETDYKRRGK